MLSEKIVTEVMDELHGRKGLGDELDRLRSDSTDVYDELVGSLTSRVGTTLARHAQEQQNTPERVSPSDAAPGGGLANA